LVKASFITQEASASLLALHDLRSMGGNGWKPVVIGTKRVAHAKRRRGPGFLRGFGDSGSAIIEFALVGPAFVLLLFSILEIGIIFFAQSTLQHASNNLARLIRTGQVQSQSLTQTQVRQLVCNDIAPLIPCDNNLMVDVESFSNFGTVVFLPPLNDDGQLQDMDNFQPGAACQVVLVRVFYAWNVFTPLLTPFLSTMAGNKHLLYAANAFRNEPFTTNLSGC
jgi:Flp pilus assembly protein TadG